MWLDALTLNVDRTVRNTNLLVWHRELWLIDHGAALYVHHAGPDWAGAGGARPFPQILAARLGAFERICRGGPGGGPIGQLPLAGRFRWLTAARSTVVQTSPVHPGLCADAAETLAWLHAQLVQ